MLEQIEADLKNALLEGDKLRVSVLRGLKSVLKNAEIEKRAKLDENEIIKVLKTAAKQRKESIEAYTKGDAKTQAAKESAELVIIQAYLPEQMTSEQIKQIVNDVVAKTDATSPADIGRVIGAVMKECQGQADGALVAQIVKKTLSVEQT